MVSAQIFFLAVLLCDPHQADRPWPVVSVTDCIVMVENSLTVCAEDFIQNIFDYGHLGMTGFVLQLTG